MWAENPLQRDIIGSRLPIEGYEQLFSPWGWYNLGTGKIRRLSKRAQREGLKSRRIFSLLTLWQAAYFSGSGGRWGPCAVCSGTQKQLWLGIPFRRCTQNPELNVRPHLEENDKDISTSGHRRPRAGLVRPVGHPGRQRGCCPPLPPGETSSFGPSLENLYHPLHLRDKLQV